MRLLRRFGCRFVVIRLELVLIYSILLLMLVLQVGLGVSYDKLLRAFNGVPRGVVFEGRDVSGRYRDELYDLVQRYALDFDLESASAVAALYDSSVDHAAAAIDVEATVQRILKAQPGSYVTAVIAREYSGRTRALPRTSGVLISITRPLRLQSMSLGATSTSNPCSTCLTDTMQGRLSFCRHLGPQSS